MTRPAPAALATLAAVLALAAAVPAGAVSLPERTLRVSDTPGGTAGAGSSTRPSLSPNGALVAFDSTATDLTNDPNGAVRDVFLRDRSTQTTRLVSAPADGVPADGPSDSPVLAGGTDLVAFVSAASNLAAGDGNGATDVFVRGGSAAPRQISLRPDGGAPAGPSSQPDISRDGRVVLFTSAAADLVPGDGNRSRDVFAADLATGAIRRISVSTRGSEAAGDSFNPAISPDGRYVSFASTAANLVRGDRNRRPDVFLADLRRGRVIERVSVDSRGRGQNRAVVPPFTQISDVSAGGRFVVFDSDATNLVRPDRNRDTDVFLRDRRRDRTVRVSLSSRNEEATNDSFAPSISPGGRFVAFESFAERIAPGDAPREDVFVRDLRRELTVVAGVTSRGARPRGPELVPQLLQRPVLSDDATVVAFTSTAANLARGDRNAREDVLVRLMAPPRGTFRRSPPRVSASPQPTIRFVADDPAARLFLCSVDRQRRICGLRTRTPVLAPGLHVLRISAGGPGMLYSPRVRVRRFRVLP
jgi:Tol biopolymer transport system component